MMDQVFGFNLTATCADGVVRSGVVLKVVDGVTIYEDADGNALTGPTCVTNATGGGLLSIGTDLAIACISYRKAEGLI